MRISEYFTDKEDAGGRLLLRTDPDTRGGLYFIISLNKTTDNLPENTWLNLQYVDAKKPDIQNIKLKIPPTNFSSIYLGITDDKEKAPGTIISWHLDIGPEKGPKLASREHFTWAYQAHQ